MTVRAMARPLGQAGGSQSLSSSRMRMIAPGSTPREQVASARRSVARMHEYGAFDGALPPGPEVIAQRVDAQRTRFVTRAMLPLYDDILWPALKPLSDERIGVRTNVDLRAQMRTMWAK